jgi:hypothetical protein
MKQMANPLTFRTKDCPIADGDGQTHTMLFDLVDGGELALEFGQPTFEKFLELFRLAPRRRNVVKPESTGKPKRRITPIGKA